MKLTCLLIIVVNLSINAEGRNKNTVPPLVITKEQFKLKKGKLLQNREIELWQVPGNPHVKTGTGYFTEYCWSSDGRFLSYDNEGSKVIDFYQNEVQILPGGLVSWANHKNLAIFLTGTRLCMFNPEEPGDITVINDHVSGRLSDTDHEDQYVYMWGTDDGLVRYALKAGARKEICGGVKGNKPGPNPFYPVINTKIVKVRKPLASAGSLVNLDGSVINMINPGIYRHHSSWLGNGEYFILGDGMVRGRKWNEPYPANLHILSTAHMGDFSMLGYSGSPLPIYVPVMAAFSSGHFPLLH
jgi:hypothetical protein